MKQFILKVAWRLAIPVAALVCNFTSCVSDSKKEEVKHDPNKPIVLTSYEPSHGRIRDMVLLDGSNFGTDISAIKVFFNAAEAKVVGSTGTRILALVPRLPGDTCVVKVQIGNQEAKEYEEAFLYNISATVTTFAGNGATGFDLSKGLIDSELTPVYLGVDSEFNIFVSINTRRGGGNDALLALIDPKNNTIRELCDQLTHGYIQRCHPNINMRTDVVMLGAENMRNNFIFLDPKENWAPRQKFIKSWTNNEFTPPLGGSNGVNHSETHNQVVAAIIDGKEWIYTRYSAGHIVKIDPETWVATIIGMTPTGGSWGGGLHPKRQNEFWFAYQQDQAGEYRNSICMVDLADETYDPETKILTSFKQLSMSGNSHRDGPLNQAIFGNLRGINFDPEGNLYVGDNSNHCIRMIKTDVDPMMVSTIVGIPGVSGYQNGNADEALFDSPHGLVSDEEGAVYVSDFNNNRIRRIAVE